jgi:methionyl-tRNA synthetase
MPSPEARAKVGGKAKGGINGRKSHKPSISDLDVQALKSFYDTPSPTSPVDVDVQFTFDAFVERVRSLIADDKALVQRLVRVAQGNVSLKSNAERATKLAQDTTRALETYQKQVRTLEERNALLAARHTQMCVR